MTEEETIKYQSLVNDIFILTKDIWKGVWQVAAESAALGFILTSVVSGSRIARRRPGKNVNKTVKNSMFLPKTKIVEKDYNKQMAKTYNLNDPSTWKIIEQNERTFDHGLDDSNEDAASNMIHLSKS